MLSCARCEVDCPLDTGILRKNDGIKVKSRKSVYGKSDSIDGLLDTISTFLLSHTLRSPEPGLSEPRVILNQLE
jgi:hypothetical protein